MRCCRPQRAAPHRPAPHETVFSGRGCVHGPPRRSAKTGHRRTRLRAISPSPGDAWFGSSRQASSRRGSAPRSAGWVVACQPVVNSSGKMRSTRAVTLSWSVRCPVPVKARPCDCPALPRGSPWSARSTTNRDIDILSRLAHSRRRSHSRRVQHTDCVLTVSLSSFPVIVRLRPG